MTCWVESLGALKVEAMDVFLGAGRFCALVVVSGGLGALNWGHWKELGAVLKSSNCVRAMNSTVYGKGGGRASVSFLYTQLLYIRYVFGTHGTRHCCIVGAHMNALASSGLISRAYLSGRVASLFGIHDGSAQAVLRIQYQPVDNSLIMMMAQ